MSEEQKVEQKEKKVKKPKSKARKIIEWILTGVFLALFGLVMVGQIDGMVHRKDHYGQQIRLGYATFVVQTTSMEPEIKKGSAIVTYLYSAEEIYNKFQKGETVDLTFVDGYNIDNETTKPHENEELTRRTSLDVSIPITHRVREIHYYPDVALGDGRYVFITAGINNGDKAGTDELGRVNQYQAFSEAQILGQVVANSAVLGGFFNFIGSPFGLLALLLVPAFYLVITSVLDIFKAYKDPDEEAATVGPNGEKAPTELSEADKKRLKEELLKEMMNKKKGD